MILPDDMILATMIITITKITIIMLIISNNAWTQRLQTEILLGGARISIINLGPFINLETSLIQWISP